MNWDDYAINIRLESAGKEFIVDRATELLGCEASAYMFNTQPNAQLDGATLINNNIEPRDITISAVSRDVPRDFIVRFFNPKQDIKITIKYGDVTRWITGRATEFAFDRNHVLNGNAFTVTLTCADPFFRDMDDFGQNLANIVKQFAFPFISPIIAQQTGEGSQSWIAKHIASYRQFVDKMTFVNGGDVETGAVFKIVARGEVTAPEITHSNGKFILMPIEMKKGDVLTINTNRGEKRIELNNANIFRRIDRRSDLFQMAVGENVIEYSAEYGLKNMDVYVYYTPRYIGI